MIALSLPAATKVYDNALQCEITRHWTQHPVLADASAELSLLIRSAQDEATDPGWHDMVGPIRRLVFTFCSTPLPFALSATSTGIDWIKIKRQTRLWQQQYPDHYDVLVSLVAKLDQLRVEQSSPLVQSLECLAAQGGKVSVILRNPRMNKPVAMYFAGDPILQGVKVVSAAQLRGAHACDVLAVIGPCAWHPEYVLSAPRAPAIHVISFRWLRDTWKPGPLLLHDSHTSPNKRHNHCIGSLPKIREDDSQSEGFASEVIALDLMPPLFMYQPNGSVGSDKYSDGMQETVPARLCHLSGNRAVFVAADDGATSLIIDTSESSRSVVRRSPVDGLEPGHYLLLRTSGGGDFIAPLADRILGTSAATRRSEQAEWKGRLIARATERYGALSRRELASRVCSELQARALSGARPANVHYWMSSKCIRPRKEEDFLAILTFAELDAKAKWLWTAMGEISRAHARAGQLIRRLLLKKISEASLEPLERDGEMIFDLGDPSGGTLSAFHIVSIEGEELEIPTDQIGVLLDGEK